MPPLTADEDAFFSALLRIVSILPRLLDLDLTRSTGLSMNEYATLRCLSGASHRELRMADLAAVACVSPSRMSRLVDGLQGRGLIRKRPTLADGRGSVAALTAEGMTQLRSAWPAHLASVRERVFNHLDPKIVAEVCDALTAVAAGIEGGQPSTGARDDGAGRT